MRSRRLLSDAEALGERASALKRGEVGVLRVGATPQVIENLLADFLSRYRKRHPGVEVHLVEDGGSGCRAAWNAATSTSPTCRPARSLLQPLLYPMHVLAVLPPEPPPEPPCGARVTELADEPLLRLGSSFASHGWFEAACQVAHIRPARAAGKRRAADADRVGRTGHGIAVVPSPVAEFRVRVSGRRWWCIAGCRSDDGPSLPGTRSGSCRLMPCNSSKSWWPIAGATIRAANSSGARRRCPGPRKRTLILVNPDSTKSFKSRTKSRPRSPGGRSASGCPAEALKSTLGRHPRQQKSLQTVFFSAVSGFSELPELPPPGLRRPP